MSSLMPPRMSRRLEDRIRELSARAARTNDPAELDEIIRNLRTALRKHAELLRKLAASHPLPLQRRSS
jgi:hypothetical protein